MENFEMGAFLGGEWESLCKMFDPDFAAIGNGFLNDPSNSIPSNDQNNYFPEISFPNYDFPLKIPISNENCHFDEFSHLATPNTDAFSLTNFGAIDGANDAFLASILSHDMINDAIPLNKDGSSCSEPGFSPTPINMEVPNKRKYSVPEAEQKSGSLAMPKKKARFTRKNKVEKSVQLKETETLSASENEDEGTTNAGSDDIAETASQETSEGEISTSKGKKRASRGEATDPQSLYARRRREKINERLRILQSLVPNGKKVDISTMLEEAVHYVKFLQLQIKLLSSDDLWMYAPIAYNGVDISLYRGISPFLLP